MSWFDASWWQFVIPCLFVNSRLTIRLFLDKKYIQYLSQWTTLFGPLAKVPEYVVSISIHSYIMPVELSGAFLAAVEIFVDCQYLGVFLNMTISACCLNGELEDCYFLKQLP